MVYTLPKDYGQNGLEEVSGLQVVTWAKARLAVCDRPNAMLSSTNAVATP